MKKNIVLIGLRGSGKTHLGKMLSEKTGMKFIDTDESIEKKEGKKIKDIFEEQGEKKFREIEKKAIKEITDWIEKENRHAVIATGGGAILNEENIGKLKEQGIIFCLKINPEKAYERIKNSDSERPSLTGRENALEEMKEIFEERKESYINAADFIVNANEDREEIKLKKILAAFKKRNLNKIKRMELKTDAKERLCKIYVGKNLIDLIAEIIHKKKYFKTLLVTDSKLEKLYIPQVMHELKSHNITPLVYTVPESEESKSLEEYSKLMEFCLKNGMNRNSLIIGFGGGMVTDLANFTASTYMRGIDFIAMPTTLLSVDSAIGGKTGVNIGEAKNIAGTFNQPEAVCFDINYLKTLPMQEIKNGLVESIKHGLIADKSLFDFIENNYESILELDENALTELIERSAAVKLKVVEDDEEENGKRKILNFGHTLGHAIESYFNYKKFSHGEAVLLGMLFSLKLSFKLGFLEKEVFERFKELTEKIEYDLNFPEMDPLKLIELMRSDKKKTNKEIEFVLLEKIGKIKTNPKNPENRKHTFAIDEKTIIETFEEIKQSNEE